MGWTNGLHLADGTEVLNFESEYGDFESGCITRFGGETFFVPDGSDGECCDLESVIPLEETQFYRQPVEIGEGRIGLLLTPNGFFFRYYQKADINMSLQPKGTTFASVPNPE